MLSTKLGISCVFLCAWAVFAQDSAPNLSGIWRLDAQKSHRSGPAPGEMRVKIEQSGADLTITTRTQSRMGEEIETARYRVGSEDNRNEMRGAPVKSSARWEGGALVIDSAGKFGEREVHVSDRWTVSPDGQTLTLAERRQFGSGPAAEDTRVFVKQANATWEPPQPPKPAEQVFKNIQVLKGMPATRVRPAMMQFSRALGVRCDYCHVEREFEKDDKPAKATARQMILMVREIDDAHFPQARLVSCWTCHHGNTKPEAAPPGAPMTSMRESGRAGQ